MVKLSIQDMVISPLISEKASQLAAMGQYCFLIHPQANKPLVKKSLESAFNVKIKDISVSNRKGVEKKAKTKKGVVTRYTSLQKKAIVTLKEGSFPFFENMQ